MIKLSYEQQQIVMLAFNDELEKLGDIGEFLPKLMNWGKEAIQAFKSTGASGGFKYLEQFKNPSFTSAAGKMTTDVAEHANHGFIQGLVGNSVSAFKNVGAGVSGETGLLDKGKKILTNMYDMGKQQLTDARFKTVDLEQKTKPFMGSSEVNKFETTLKDGKQYVGSRNSILPDRQIMGTAADGKAIVKKRPWMQAAAMSMTPVGFGATSFLMNKDKKEGFKEGIKDTALWTFAEPIGIANSAKDILFNKSKKEDQNNGQTVN